MLFLQERNFFMIFVFHFYIYFYFTSTLFYLPQVLFYLSANAIWLCHNFIRYTPICVSDYTNHDRDAVCAPTHAHFFI